jgi:hypothetical protein
MKAAARNFLILASLARHSLGDGGLLSSLDPGLEAVLKK